MIDIDALFAAQSAVYDAVRDGRDGAPEMVGLLNLVEPLGSHDVAHEADAIRTLMQQHDDWSTPSRERIATIATQHPDLLPFVIIRETVTGARPKNLVQLEPFRQFVRRYGQVVLGLEFAPVLKPNDDLVYRLEKRAEIRRTAVGRKSVEEGRPDRIADLLDEAAAEIRRLRV